MSYFLMDYLESRLEACDTLIAQSSDIETARIYEDTKKKLLEDIENIRRQCLTSPNPEDRPG